MTQLIFVRHGYSKGNKEKRFSGQMDIALDELGYRQAASVAHYILRNYQLDAIYSSDLCRAYDTVKPIADALHLDVHQCKALREVDVGEWQGMLIEDVKKKYPDSFDLYRKKPGIARFDGGESYSDMLERVLCAIEKIAKENDGKTVVIGTHGGVIRVLRAAWTGIALDQIEVIPHVPNASVSVFAYENGTAVPSLIGYCDYLDEKILEEAIK